MDEYEKKCEAIRQDNQKLLEEFRSSLEASGLTEKTIKNHVQNINFYANDYLLYYEDITELKDGISEISMFLGYWFIKKAMWSSEAAIRSNAASFKKFYAFLLTKGMITGEQLSELKSMIKEEMPEWLEEMRAYEETYNDIW